MKKHMQILTNYGKKLKLFNQFDNMTSLQAFETQTEEKENALQRSQHGDGCF